MGPVNVFSLPAGMMSSFVNRGYGGDIAGGSFLPASDALLLADSYDMGSFSSPHLLLHRCFLLLDAGSTQSHRLRNLRVIWNFCFPWCPMYWSPGQVNSICWTFLILPSLCPSFPCPSPPPPFPLLMLQFKLCMKGLDSSYPAANACIFTSN